MDSKINMEKPNTIKENVLKQFRTQKAKDYTFSSLFFLIFSVFIIFAIRPSLVTAISLNQQLRELKKIDSQYENVVSNIVVNQSEIESNRDKLYLIGQAMPSRALINKLVSDVENEGRADSINFVNLNIIEVNLIQQTKGAPESVIINVEAISTFDNLQKFMRGLSNQRRLKVIKKLSISRDTEISTESSELKVLMQIEGFYL